MSTSAQILFPDRSVAVCYWDGYPEFVGPKLRAWHEAGMPSVTSEADGFVAHAEADRRKEYPKEFRLGRLINKSGRPTIVPGDVTVIEYQEAFRSRDLRGDPIEPADDGHYNYTYTVTLDGRIFSGRELR